MGVCPLELREYSNISSHLFKKYINFLLFTPQLPTLKVGSYEIYTFLYHYPKDVVKIDLVVFKEDFNAHRRRTTTDANP